MYSAQRQSRLQVAERLKQQPSHGRRSHDPLRRVFGIRVLERLAPDHREAVVLTKYAGYSTAEAAAWLGDIRSRRSRPGCTEACSRSGGNSKRRLCPHDPPTRKPDT